MRSLLMVLLALVMFGCSQANVSNSSVIDEMEESIEFDVADSEQSISRAVNFIRDLNHREPKSRFSVYYKTGSSEFVDKLNAKFKSEGIAKNRYRVVLAEADQQKAVLISATYVRIKSRECGVMTFASRDEYRFGCALEHNRNMSLVNPIKSEL